jgi:hypothetical protein
VLFFLFLCRPVQRVTAPACFLLHAAFPPPPRVAFRCTGPVPPEDWPVRSLRLLKKQKKEEKQCDSKQKKEEKNKTEKNRGKKQQKRTRDDPFSSFCSHLFGVAACLSPPLPLFFLSLFLIRTCDQQRV